MSRSEIPSDARANQTLQVLLDRMADDQLDAAEAAHLEQLLSTSSDARRSYIEMASLCADLEWTCGDEPQADWAGESRPSASQPSPSAILPRARGLRSSLASFAAGALAASLLLAALGAVSWPGDAGSTAGKSAEPGSGDYWDDSPRIAATLSGLVDCKWSDEVEEPTYGEQLTRNRHLNLESGLAQLTFESGAKLILQGPAEFVVRSEMEGSLRLGKLTAVVPQRAQGFSVTTPSAEIVDLGTEFGIEVNDAGRTEVHVFEGEVISWGANPGDDIRGEAISLTKNAGASYDVGAMAPTDLKADSSKFAREVTPRLTESELPKLPVHRKLALWLAADVMVKRDGQDRVIAWRDIAVGDNQMEEDAWQHDSLHRPRWVEQSIGGKPAVRFDGQSSYLVTTPIPTTEDQTLFFVFQRAGNPNDPNQMYQLINYNGPPYTLPDLSKPFRILQIDDRDQPGAYRAFVYAGIEGRYAVHFGKVRMKQPVAPNAPLILAYTYSTQENQAELLVNGVSQGIATGVSGDEFVSRKILGKHPLQEQYFQGDMSEVLIYNSGLPRQKVARVTKYLSKKYSIDIPEAN